MTQGDRTAGSMPVWDSPERAENAGARGIEEQLASAQNGTPENADSFKNTLAYSAALNGSGENSAQNAPAPEEFGFGDLVDMINPLQHIPLIGHLYRSITGDEIRPIGQIIGGGIFGGPIGAAGGLVNAVIEEETGKDLSGNALAFVLEGKTPDYKTAPFPHVTEAPPSAPLIAQNDALPGSLLSFVDLKADHSFKIGRLAASDTPTS